MSLAPPPPPPPGPPPLSPAAKIENDWNNNIIIELVYYLFTRDTQKKTDPIHILITSKYNADLKIVFEKKNDKGVNVKYIKLNLKDKLTEEDLTELKKLNDITEDIIIIKDSITNYLDIDNFFDF